MKRGDLRALEQALGYEFANSDLLARALTHGSALSARTGEESYQRLEFLGDRVLGLVVADILLERFPKASEGELSLWFHRLVSGETCAEVGEELELAKYVRMGKGPRRASALVTQSVLADACESIIGAVYSDAGLAAARTLIERLWGPRVEAVSRLRRDAKSELQEWAHRRGFDAPVYAEVLRSGPDHAPQFEIEVSVGRLPPETARGRSKREAEHEAAAMILRREGIWEKA
jgi:ribonuclease III